MKVVLTRDSEDNTELKHILQKNGFEVIECPCVAFSGRLVPENDLNEILEAGKFKAMIFTSPRGVRYFMEVLGSKKIPEEMLIGVVGKGTLREFEKHGMKTSIITGSGSSDFLAEKLTSILKSGDKVVYIRGNLVAGDLSAKLSSKGIEMKELIVYDNVTPEVKTLPVGEDYIIVCASPSGVERFLEANPSLKGVNYVAIGYTTARRMEECRIKKIFVADEPSVDGILKTILQIAEKEKS